MATIVNFYGGPSSGKSTIAAETFAKLKHAGVNCELVTEYAKQLVWRESFKTFKDQIYIFAKQNNLIKRCADKVDIVVTDSPILLSLYYGKNQSAAFKQLVVEQHNEYPSLNIFLRRLKSYNPVGRMQTQDEAKQIDVEILQILNEQSIPYEIVDGNEQAAGKIVEMLLFQSTSRIGRDESKDGRGSSSNTINVSSESSLGDASTDGRPSILS